jgi:hypothetical protein
MSGREGRQGKAPHALKLAAAASDIRLTDFMTAVMDVVVPCDCGTRFSFSVEPVNGRLPEGAELLCPKCGKDGVPLANRVIGEDLRRLQRDEAWKAKQNGDQQPPKKNGWLKREKNPETKKEAAQPDLYSSSYAAEAHDPYEKGLKKSKEDDSVYHGPNRVKGVIGALIGGLIGAVLWAASVYLTGYEIRYVAIGVGALAGLGSRTLGGGRDYHLGLFASACAFAAILVGVYFGAKLYTQKTISVQVATFEYNERIEKAKEAATLTTQEEYKDFIAASKSTIFRPVAPASITAKEVIEFQTTELPKLKKFASGEPSRETFIQAERRAYLEKLTTKDFFEIAITPYLFLWVFLGVGAAWKLASDYGTSVE